MAMEGHNMENSMLRYFISDLHLQEERDDLTALFYKFIHGPAQDAQELYVLGDLFNVWMGDDLPSAYNDAILNEFKMLSEKGVKCYFMPGNRDFLIGKLFIQKSKFTILPDYYKIDINGTATLLSHGDLLCTDDKAYQRYRKVARNKLICKLFLMLPLKKRIAIAQSMRKKSIQHQRNAKADTLQANEQAMLKACNRFGVRNIIYGHVHHPQQNQVHNITQYVLGDWHKHGATIVKASEQIELVSFT